MGEITDAMVNGLMCQSCGQFMPDMEEPGYPRECGDCKKEARLDSKRNRTNRNKRRKQKRKQK